MQRTAGKRTRRDEASEAESISSLDYEGAAPSKDFVNASFHGGSGMRGAVMAGSGPDSARSLPGVSAPAVIGPTSVRPEVRFSLLFVLFMGGFIQLLGFNCQLSVTQFLAEQVLVHNNDKSRNWASLALFPYAGLAVVGSILYLVVITARAKRGLELTASTSSRGSEGNSSATGNQASQRSSEATETTSMLQRTNTAILDAEQKVKHGVLSGCSFHLRFALALNLMALSFVPLMTLAVHYKSLTCAIISMALNGIAQSWLTGCLVGLCAALENPKTMVAYNLGNAAAAWPAAIFGIVFVAQKNFQPSVAYCHVLFAVNAVACCLYYFASYSCVLKPFAEATDEIAVAIRQREENRLDFFAAPAGSGSRSGSKIVEGFPVARDGSFASSSGALGGGQNSGEDEENLLLAGQQSNGTTSGEQYNSNRNLNINYMQMKKPAINAGSGAGDLAHIGSEIGKNDVNRPFSQVLCASWQIIVAMFVHFLFTFVVFPGVTLKWKAPVDLKLNAAQLWQLLLAIFIVFDTVGRYTPQLFALPARFLLLAVLVRGFLLLPPYFLFPYYQVGLEWHIIVMVLFAWTQGHLTTNIFIHSGENAISYREIGLLGPTISSALVIGLLAGAGMQFGIDKALPAAPEGASANPATAAGV